jgi:MazG family protein
MSDSSGFSATGASIGAGAPRAGDRFQQLVDIMARLRSPQGCPWDREQNFDTIKPYTLEEVYEVLDAIDARDWPGLAEEIGDLMLQCVFYAQMASERNLFSIADSLEAIRRKLIRRHPHVFGDATAETAAEVKHRWDQIKAEEKREQGRQPALLDSVPRSQPALAEAQQISSKVAKVGFDWPGVVQVVEKLHEELAEIAEARETAPEKLEEEIGDLLFVVVNLARHSGVDAEQALRRANAKFRTRFAHVESRLQEQKKPLGEATLDQMEALWQEAKRIP